MATGTPPCGGSLTGGTLTSAQYTASYSYDTLGRLTSAPLGSYTYGDPNHLDAATSVGTTYTASYDAAGDMTCRAPTNTVTCSGTPTGAVMTYDAERRLATWQNTPSNPTSTASYWYDGEGHRVAQTYNGVTTYYVGDDEEITGSTLLKYYHIPALPVLGTIVGVTRTYLASDGLGSESVDLSYNGSVLATALYGPYGVDRYATGTMPSSKGYTGQRQDSGSGLDYYNARYYDPTLGQFTSADTKQGGDRYGYVGGNPETAMDPSGHVQVGDPGGGAPNPVTDLPNYWSMYQQYYWHDQCAGDGCYHPLNDEGVDAAANPMEAQDGPILAKYFGLSVNRIPDGDNTVPDFNVVLDFGTVENPGLGADFVGPKYETPIELLTPASDSKWDAPHNPRNGGVVKKAYDKARQQNASIVAIDLRNIDPDGKLSKDQLQAYATTIMYWGAPESQGPSQVMRVLFIRSDGSIVDIQANPQNPYGPPPRSQAPPKFQPVPGGDVPEAVPEAPVPDDPEIPPIDVPPLI